MLFYQHNTNDDSAETAHLTLLEYGCAHRMKNWCIRNEKPLPLDEDQLMRMLCARNADEKQAVKNVLKDFYIKTEHGWVSEGIERILSDCKKKSEKAKQSANAGWEKRKSKGYANALKAQSKGNANNRTVTINNNIKDGVPPFSEGLVSSDTEKSESPDFERFWNNYPRKDGKKKAESVFKRLSKSSQEKAIADCLHRYKHTARQFIPHASTYLNGERWLDPLPSPSQAQVGASQQAVHWLQTSSGITAKGKELGLYEDQFEGFAAFKIAVIKKAKEINPGLRVA